MLLHLRIIALVFAMALALRSDAQLPQVSDSRLGVDSLQLVDGSHLYGFVLDRSPDGSITIAIEREWLSGKYPQLHAALATRELEIARQAQAELIPRLEAWLKERPEPGPLLRYLEVHLEEAREKEVKPVDDKLFFSATFSKEEVRKCTIQAHDRRHIAGIAYQNELEDVVLTPTSVLAKRLDEIGVKPEAETVDLTGELPPTVLQSERQWAARKALVEFNQREPLEYQGTGSMLLRAGEEPNAGALIGQLLTGGGSGDAISRLGAELGLPEFAKPRESSDWWKKTTQSAERDGFNGVLITRLEQNMLSPDVTVEAIFFAKLAPDEWFRVATFKAKSSANEQAGQRLDQLKQDPQIQTVVSALEALGLSANGQLDQALRHGAATQVALAEAHASWYTFQQLHTRSLSGTPVPLE